MMAAKSTIQMIEERSRKRRIISAVTWFPPREGEHNGWRLMAMKTENPYMERPQFLQPTIQPNYFTPQNAYQQMVQQIKTTNSDPNMREFGDFHCQRSYSQQSVHSQDEHQRTVGPQEQSANAIHRVVLTDISTEKTREEISCLLDSGLPLDILNEDEETPLFVACRHKNLSMVAILMELGANPCIMNKQYSTCLHQAVHNFDVKMVEHLLKSDAVKAEIDEVDFMDRTPLMITAMEDAFSSDIAELLVTAGANVSFPGDLNSPSYRGRTPLHYAALYGNSKMIRFLINKGANSDATDREECTPLFLAARAGRLESVTVLVDMGASQRLTDQTDKTPYQIAIDNRWTEIVEFFHTRKDTVFVAKPAIIKPKLKRRKKINPAKLDKVCKRNAEDAFSDSQTHQMFHPAWHQNLPKIENMMTNGLHWHPSSSLAFSRESCHDDNNLYYANGYPFMLPKHEVQYPFM